MKKFRISGVIKDLRYIANEEDYEVEEVIVTSDSIVFVIDGKKYNVVCNVVR